jgi:hypothetical protein
MHTKPTILQLQLCKFHILLSGATCFNPTATIRGFSEKMSAFKVLHIYMLVSQAFSFTH